MPVTSIANPPHSRPPAPEDIAFWGLLVCAFGMIAVAGPILTSDGPSHAGMAHFMTVAGDPAWPMLNRLYELNPVLSPNALGHFLLAAIMTRLPPMAAEAVMQAICIAAPVLAGRLALRRLAPGATAYAVFFFPIALQRLFYLGLYNFCLSLAGALLCLWAYFGFKERGTQTRGALLGGALLLTLGCQASGWMEAVLAIGLLALVDGGFRLSMGQPKGRICGTFALLALCVMPSLILFLFFALQGGANRETIYAIPLFGRIVEFLRGDAFAPIGRTTTIFSCLVTATLGGLCVLGWIKARAADAHDPSARERRWSMTIVFIGFILFMLAIPDQAGGGWSHFWRAAVFPAIGLILLAAQFPVQRTLRLSAVAIASASALSTMALTLKVQRHDLPPVLADFEAADALIGPHCTTAPILSNFKLDMANTARLASHPLFHLANRIALKDDRPVLFNYNARLPVYPVRFRPDVDPQRLLYGWQTAQRDTHVDRIDTGGFEAATGIAVDYVLLWDIPSAEAPGPFHDLRAGSLAGYRMIHQSADHRLELYRRTAPGGCSSR